MSMQNQKYSNLVFNYLLLLFQIILHYHTTCNIPALSTNRLLLYKPINVPANQLMSTSSFIIWIIGKRTKRQKSRVRHRV